MERTLCCTTVPTSTKLATKSGPVDLLGGLLQHSLTHSLTGNVRSTTVLQSGLPYGHSATVRLARWPAVQCWLALASAYTEVHAPRNRPRHQVLPVLWVTLRVLYGNAPGIGRGMRPSTGGQGEVASNCTAKSGVEISTRTFSESHLALRARPDPISARSTARSDLECAAHPWAM